MVNNTERAICRDPNQFATPNPYTVLNWPYGQRYSNGDPAPIAACWDMGRTPNLRTQPGTSGYPIHLNAFNIFGPPGKSIQTVTNTQECDAVCTSQHDCLGTWSGMVRHRPPEFVQRPTFHNPAWDANPPPFPPPLPRPPAGAREVPITPEDNFFCYLLYEPPCISSNEQTSECAVQDEVYWLLKRNQINASRFGVRPKLAITDLSLIHI